MIRHCDGTDEFLTGEDGKPCQCGSTFDDVDHLVIYPHGKIDKTGIPALLDQVGRDLIQGNRP